MTSQLSQMMNMYSERANSERQDADSKRLVAEEEKRDREGVEVPVGLELIQQGLSSGRFADLMKKHVVRHLVRKAVPREFIKKHGIEGLLDAYEKGGAKGVVAHVASKVPIDLDKLHAAVGGKENYDLIQGVIRSGGSKQQVTDAIGEAVKKMTQAHVGNKIDAAKAGGLALVDQGKKKASVAIRRVKKKSAVVARKVKQKATDSTQAVADAADRAQKIAARTGKLGRAEANRIRDEKIAQVKKKQLDAENEIRQRREDIANKAGAAKRRVKRVAQEVEERASGAKQDLIDGGAKAKRDASQAVLDAHAKLPLEASARAVVGDAVEQTQTSIESASRFVGSAASSAKEIPVRARTGGGVAAGMARSMRSGGSEAKRLGDLSYEQLQKKRGWNVKTTSDKPAGIELPTKPIKGFKDFKGNKIRIAEKLKKRFSKVDGPPERRDVRGVIKQQTNEQLQQNYRAFEAVNNKIKSSSRSSGPATTVKTGQDEAGASPDAMEVPEPTAPRSSVPSVPKIAKPVSSATIEATSVAQVAPTPAPLSRTVDASSLEEARTSQVAKSGKLGRSAARAWRDAKFAEIKRTALSKPVKSATVEASPPPASVARRVAPPPPASVARRVDTSLPDINETTGINPSRATTSWQTPAIKPKKAQLVRQGKVPGKAVYESKYSDLLAPKEQYETVARSTEPSFLQSPSEQGFQTKTKSGGIERQALKESMLRSLRSKGVRTVRSSAYDETGMNAQASASDAAYKASLETPGVGAPDVLAPEGYKPPASATQVEAVESNLRFSANAQALDPDSGVNRYRGPVEEFEE